MTSSQPVNTAVVGIKPWWQSKTIAFATLASAAAGAQLAIPQLAHAVTEVLDGLGIILGLLAAGSRFTASHVLTK